MHSNKIILHNLEIWIKNKVPNEYKAAWIDISKSDKPILENKYFNFYEESQSKILKYICENNNIPFEIYEMNEYSSDQERLCQYSKFLSWKSENYKTVLFSKILKENFYFGEYKRYGKDELDFFPFANMTQSQIDSLDHFIETKEDILSFPIKSKLEWLYNQDTKFKIIASEQSPTKNIMWGTYNLEQRAVVAKYYALVRDRQHKISNDKYFL